MLTRAISISLPTLAAAIIACAIAGATAAHAQSLAVGAPGAQPIPGRLILKLRTTDRDAVAMATQALAPVADQLRIVAVSSWLRPELLLTPPRWLARNGKNRKMTSGTWAGGLARIVEVRYAAVLSPELAATKVQGLANVEFAEPAYARRLSYVPNDSLLSLQGYLDQIGALDAWELLRADTSITIAITDTGIDPTHPELKNAIWHNNGEGGIDSHGRDRRTNGIDDDGNGVIDDWAGYDFGGNDGFSPDNNPMPYFFHGTHVAGLAAATGDNHTGIAGVAFGARLMSVKITDDQAGGDPLISKGYDGIFYAAKMGARIINCSWGGPGFSKAEQELIDTVTAWGSLVVAAAGNDNADISSYPAAYRGVLSVASVLRDDRRSTFSNYNASVDLAAPGDAMYSTTLMTAGDGYRYSSGTSMASPVVAGAAALVALQFPTYDPAQITAVLKATADDISAVNPNVGGLLGSGRLNLRRAIYEGSGAASAEVIDYGIVDQQADGIVDAGETIELRIRVRNMLRPVADLRAVLSVSQASIVVETPVVVFGPTETGQEHTSTAGTLRMQIPSPLPTDYKLRLHVTLLDGDRQIGSREIDLPINPNYATTAYNRMAVTFTGNGRIGFNDFPNNEQGYGFHLDSTSNMLAEGGMLIGTAAERLADVVRNGSYGQSQGLQVVRPYRVAYSAAENAMIGTAAFNDAHLSDQQRNGLRVDLRTVQYNEPNLDNATFLFYTIRNQSANMMRDLHCALYFDWDIGPAGSFDQAAIDLAHRMGYTRNTRDTGLPLAAVILATDQPMDFNALNNGEEPLIGIFDQGDKWDVISQGIGHEQSAVGDCSIIAGAGPLELASGADTTVVFVLAAGKDLEELQTIAEHAAERLRALGYSTGGPIFLPRDLSMTEPHPNPFADATTLHFTVPRDAVVTIDAYTVSGEYVARLADDYFHRGTHTIQFRPTGIANGPYIVQMQALGNVIARKLVYIGAH